MGQALHLVKPFVQELPCMSYSHARQLLRKRYEDPHVMLSAYRKEVVNWPFCSFFQFFFYCYLADPLPTLGHSQGNSLTNPMLITAFVQVQTEGHQKPRNEVGSLNLAECLAGFEPGTFRFWLQHLNPLGHSPQDTLKSVMNSKGYRLKKELKSSLQ